MVDSGQCAIDVSWLINGLGAAYVTMMLTAMVLALRPSWKRTHNFLPVSIVVCARNEVKALPDTLAAFEKLEYPQEMIEYILVDHSSSDGTAQIFQAFAQRDPTRRKIVTIPADYYGLRGKAGPWHAGMEHATAEIVFTTGADCIVPPRWISRTLELYDADTQIVSGAAVLSFPYRRDTFFSRMQNLDMILIQGMGYTVSNAGMGGAGLSNNFSLRRAAYEAVGGFRELGFSICEDVLLSAAILQKYGNQAIRVHLDPLATPATPPETLRRLPNMKMRWSMGTRRLGFGGLVTIAIAFLTHLFLPLSLFATCLTGAENSLIWIAISWLCTTLFLTIIAVRLERLVDLIALPLFLPYLWLYTTLAGIPVIFRLPVKWRGLWVREPV